MQTQDQMTPDCPMSDVLEGTHRKAVIRNGREAPGLPGKSEEQVAALLWSFPNEADCERDDITNHTAYHQILKCCLARV